MVGAVAALTILTAGPASAVAPTNVAAGTPSWSPATTSSPAILKASGSFKNSATGATYSYTLQLVRTSSPSTKPYCPTVSGCLTSASQTLLSSSGLQSISVLKASSVTVPTLAVKCAVPTPTIAANRYYWSWLKVADSSGNVVMSISLFLAGKYC
ncbi:unannotated protein [freshwater metagenome]|uniref:Unannotated protein n=1 Tax=freshwater metagenome TaxID=449393 RepID=A0A6J7KIM5_9ZZZZ